MKNSTLCGLGVVLIGILPLLAYDDNPKLDSRAIKVKLPVADVALSYVEASPQALVEISAGTTTIEGVRFFIGDGKIAVPLEADPLNGIRFQENQKLEHGHRFAKYSIVEVEPGYKAVDELKAGDVYIVFPAVNFVPTK